MTKRSAVVIGAGIGGMSAAAHLHALGCRVTICDALPHPGGKMRGVPTIAGLADAGPTVLTMVDVIADLFTLLGTRMADHIQVTRQPTVARHFWPDGSQLDLFSDPVASADAIAAFAGRDEARNFQRFRERAARLFDGFSAPVMTTPTPSVWQSAKAVLRQPRLALDMAPHQSLAQALDSAFGDARLRQLFGRYATYVGGSPFQAPALLSLIWAAEEAGVWHATGGMHGLAAALADALTRAGVDLALGRKVAQIITDNGAACGVVLEDGTQIDADLVVFNGDPKALTDGHLGQAARHAIRAAPLQNRSLSANVLAFAGTWSGPDIVHHNVFFTADPHAEFDPIAQGRSPDAATLYLCAQDRADGTKRAPGPERFEVIENAAPARGAPKAEEAAQCLTRITQGFQLFGVAFDPAPTPRDLTSPHGFQTLFPGSDGSLYGQSPHGLTAAMARPTARTKISGLYLAGGGTHPGAGVPMAALSGRHAGAAIAADLGLTWPSRKTDTPGGTWTGSATAAPSPSLLSRS